ncbi:HepT-like ribonuclease domain-containing protein [Demequina aurantiaca]|uniref:HepT-like ribonuclease domain-containing protein n=1 Tax=Demequina aurantiaca TaxID=676200 RepID=UPI003D3480EC
MDRRTAKELIHIAGWLDQVGRLVGQGRDAYLADELLQEAGDSLMMKLGEAAGRLARLGIAPPKGVEWTLAIANRNFLIHQYDQVNRALTWETLAGDLPAWADALLPLVARARKSLDSDGLS